MNKIFIFLTLLLSLFCSSFIYQIPPPPPYCEIIDNITHKFLREYIKPKGLICIGSGGSMMDDVKKVSLSFVSFKALNVEEARILYVDIIEEYLKRVNSDEEVRPFLHNFPFTIDSLDFDIRFDYKNNCVRKDGHVAFMFIRRDQNICYKASDVQTGYYSIHREPYSEALEIVQKLK